MVNCNNDSLKKWRKEAIRHSSRLHHEAIKYLNSDSYEKDKSERRSATVAD